MSISNFEVYYQYVSNIMNEQKIDYLHVNKTQILHSIAFENIE